MLFNGGVASMLVLLPYRVLIEFAITTVAAPTLVGKRVFLRCHFILKTIFFTKTDSGQTQGKLRQTTFLQLFLGSFVVLRVREPHLQEGFRAVPCGRSFGGNLLALTMAAAPAAITVSQSATQTAGRQKHNPHFPDC